MEIFLKKTKNLIMPVVLTCVFALNVGTIQAACFWVCDNFAPCPSGYSVYTNQMLPWPWSPYGWACFPCGGYGCFGAAWTPTFGFRGGMVCSQITSYFLGNPAYPLGSCMEPGSYVTACNAECAPNHFNCKIGPVIPGSPRNEPTGWAWACQGFNGRNDHCFEPYPVPVVNGACQTFLSGVDPLPTASNQLCLTGTASAVSGNGTNSSPWTWTCVGSGTGHTNANCYAKKPCVYDNYSCSRSPFDVKCENTYPENCGKSLPVNMVCSARDVNGTCSGVLSQSDCVNAGVPCSNSTETCASCPLEPGRWREVAP